MSWICRLIDIDAAAAEYGDDLYYRLRPGDMWEVNRVRWETDRAGLRRDWLILSPEYWRDHGDRRPPLQVVLPGQNWFDIDSRAGGTDHGWTVTGEPPNLTVSPSINSIGSYHGWLRGGVLSDDVEGRRFG